MTFLSYHLVTSNTFLSAPFDVVCPVVQWSSVLCKFRRKKINFIRVSPPACCHPGQSALPPPPAY